MKYLYFSQALTYLLTYCDVMFTYMLKCILPGSDIVSVPGASTRKRPDRPQPTWWRPRSRGRCTNWPIGCNGAEDGWNGSSTWKWEGPNDISYIITGLFITLCWWLWWIWRWGPGWERLWRGSRTPWTSPPRRRCLAPRIWKGHLAICICWSQNILFEDVET